MASAEISEPSVPRVRWRLPKLDRLSLVVLIVVILAYLPLLFSLGQWLWKRDHYSFFPWTFPIVGYFLWRAYSFRSLTIRGRRWISTTIAALAYLILFVAFLLNSPWIAGISAMVMLMCLLYAIGGIRLVLDGLPAWLLLWLVVPIPLSFDRELIMAMQRFATRISSGVLDLMGYRHVVDGVVLTLTTRSYQVEEACSGIQSLFSAMFCIGVYLVACGARFLRAIIVLLAGIFWVLAGNISRIVSVVVLREDYGLPVDQGVYHSMMGFLFFALVILFTISTESLFAFMLPHRENPDWDVQSSEPSERKRRRKKSERVQLFSHGSSRIIAGAFGCLMLIQFVSLAATFASTSAPLNEVALLQDDDLSLLPENLDGWVLQDKDIIRREFDDVNGAVSKLWIYQKDGIQCEVSFDGPYTEGWHHLPDCYVGNGWDVGEPVSEAYNSFGERFEGGCLRFDVSRSDGQLAHVIYGVFDGHMRAFETPTIRKLWRQQGRIQDLKLRVASLFGMGDPRRASSSSTSFQVHVLIRKDQMVNEEERIACRELFQSVISHMQPSNASGGG